MHSKIEPVKIDYPTIMYRCAPYLISLLIVAALISLVDFSSARRLLVKPDWSAFAIGVGCYVLSLVLRGLRFQLLIPRFVETRTGWKDSFDLAVFVTFANHVLPFRLGEAIFILLARLRHGVPTERGLVVLLIARLYDLLSLIVIFVSAAMVVRVSISSVWYGALGVLIVVLIFAAVRLDLAVRLGRLIVLQLAWWLRRDRSGSLDRTLAKLERAESGLAVLRQPGLIAANVALSLGVWLSVIGCFYELLTAFGLNMPFELVAVGSLGASLTALLPINAVGNIGTLEVGWVIGFVALGMDRSDAIASGLGMHVIVIVTSGILTLWSAIRLGESTRRRLLDGDKHEAGA